MNREEQLAGIRASADAMIEAARCAARLVAPDGAGEWQLAGYAVTLLAALPNTRAALLVDMVTEGIRLEALIAEASIAETGQTA